MVAGDVDVWDVEVRVVVADVCDVEVWVVVSDVVVVPPPPLPPLRMLLIARS